MRPKTLPPRTFQLVISPSTQTDPHRSMNPRMVSLRRPTEVGVVGEESRGATESGGGACPGIDSAAKEVIGSFLGAEHLFRPQP